jgi:excisionase family DNA binding protein
MSAAELMAKGTVTPKQAVERYGIPRSRIFELLRDGELAKVKLSERKVLIPISSIEAYLASKLIPASA